MEKTIPMTFTRDEVLTAFCAVSHMRVKKGLSNADKHYYAELQRRFAQAIGYFMKEGK